MGRQSTSEGRTFIAEGSGIVQGLLVKQGTEGNEVTLNGSGDTPIGFVNAPAEDGEPVAVTFMNSPGTFSLIASKAITAKSLVYAAASGKVTDADTGAFVGIAIDAAAADGDPIEIVPAFASSLPSGVATAYTDGDDFVAGFNNAAVSAGVQVYTTAGDAGLAFTIADTAGGILDIETDDDNNDQARAYRTKKVWQNRTGKITTFEGKFRVVQTDDDRASFFFGLSSSVADDLTADTTGLLADPVDAVGVYAPAASNVLSVVTSRGAAQTITATTVDIEDWNTYRVIIDGSAGGTQAVVTHIINDVVVATHQAASTAYGSAATMAIIGHIKTHHASKQNLQIDYYNAAADR